MKIPFRDYWDVLSVYVKPRKILFAGTSLFLLSGIGLQILNPQIMRGVIDGASSGKPLETLAASALLFIVLALAQQVVSVTAVWLGENLAWQATNDLRRDLAAHCLRLDMGFHTVTPPGDMIQRIDGDVAEFSGFFSQMVVRVAGNAILLCGILVVLIRENALLGLVFCAFAAVTLAALYAVRGIAVGPHKELREANTELAGFIEERLSGTEDIRSSGAEGWVLRGLYRIQRLILVRWRKASLREVVIRFVVGFLMSIGFSIAFLGGFSLYRGGAITVGTVFLILNYTSILNRPIRELVQQVQNLQNVGASVARIRDLKALDPEARGGNGTVPDRGPLAVGFDGVTFSYKKGEPVLRDLSFSLGTGKILGFLGRTGSGKSTVARLLFRLYAPEEGRILLSGSDAATLPLPLLRRRVGMVTQEVQLFQATVRDNITFFDASVPDGAIREAIRALGLEEWLARLPDGLDTDLRTAGRGLSAGEGQLLAFTRIFLRDPGLVILDEASSRLDPATEQLIERAVDRLLAGRTALIIAHRLATVERADDILILEQGRVLEYGARASLAADPDSRFSHLLRRGMEEVLA